MTQLCVLNNNAIFHINRALRCLALLGVVFVSACTSESVAVAASPPEAIYTTSSSPAQSEQRTVRYQLTPAPLNETSPRQRGAPPFRLLAPFSERARIVDMDGNEIRRATDGGSIGRLDMSPNQQWALLYFGSAKYSVASTESLEDIVRPPIRPDGFDDATGFSWFILDDDHLIGQADLPSLETEGLTASEKESLPPRDTLIYVYTISSGTMTPVEIDDTLPRPFHITEASEGYVTLLPFFDLGKLGAKILRIPGP